MAVQKVSLLDLTVDQVEAIEVELGKPVDEWSELPSRMKLFRRIYSTVTGEDDATVGRMSLKELTEAVTLDEDAEVTEAANPTDQPTA